MAPVTEQTAVVDAGPCRGCGCVQWNHRLGKKGCKDPLCGCGKYEPPKTDPGLAAALAEPEPVDEPEPEAAPVVADPAAQAAYVEQVAAIDAQLAAPSRPSLAASVPHAHTLGMACPASGCRWPTEDPEWSDDEVADEIDRAFAQAEAEQSGRVAVEPAPTCAYPNGEDQGEHDHALCEDVVDERTETRAAAGRPMPPADFLAAHTNVSDRAAAGYGWQVGYLAGQAASAAERDASRRERNGFEVQRDQAYERVDELTEELGRVAAVLGVGGDVDLDDVVHGLKADLEQARAALADAIRTGTSAAANVLFRYDARQCEDCGFRTAAPDVDHEHPLTPVAVLVVRREVSGA